MDVPYQSLQIYEQQFPLFYSHKFLDFLRLQVFGRVYLQGQQLVFLRNNNIKLINNSQSV